MARIVFLCRIRIPAKMLAIPFPTLDQMNVLKAVRDLLTRIDHIAQHFNVFFDAFHSAFAVFGASTVEYVRDLWVMTENLVATFTIKKVRSQPLRSCFLFGRIAAQTKNRPAGLQEPLNQPLGYGARRTDHQRRTVKSRIHLSISSRPHAGSAGALSSEARHCQKQSSAEFHRVTFLQHGAKPRAARFSER